MEPDTSSQPSYPVQFDVDYPDRELNRWSTAFRIFAAIPILIIAAAIGGTGYANWGGHTTDATITTAGLLTLPVVLMIVFRQKYPRWWFDWNLELMRFLNRIGVYLALLDDRYPSTDERQSVMFDMPYPDAKNEPEPLAAARQVDPRDPALRRARVSRHRSVLRRRLRVVRDHLHRPLSARRFRLRGRGHSLVQPRPRVRVRPRHRRVPTVPPQPLASGFLQRRRAIIETSYGPAGDGPSRTPSLSRGGPRH